MEDVAAVVVCEKLRGGSRNRERIGNGVGTTGMGVGAGDWELARK